MMKAKKKPLMMLIHMNHGLKSCCSPAVRSIGVMICPMYAVAYAPMIPVAAEKMTRNGMMVISPSIFGRMR